MRNNILSIGFGLLIIMMSIACQSNKKSKKTTNPTNIDNSSSTISTTSTSTITSINYHMEGGGRGGFGITDFIMRRDSCILSQSKRGVDSPLKSKKTDIALWNSLINAISMKDFDSIKSKLGKVQYDGTDITITIETIGGTKHTLVNGHDDIEPYKKITTFVSMLEKELTKLANN